MGIFDRTKMLLNDKAFNQIQNSKVAVFGIGGVGSFVCEALVRSGIGSIVLVDDDIISETNINRQLIALHSNIGKHKCDVMKERLMDINPGLKVELISKSFEIDNIEYFNFNGYDYIVDAIDTVTSKILLIEMAKKFSIKIISCMGTGNKLNPFLFKIVDISKTKVCPLAKVMRKELKDRNIDNVKVLFSEEIPIKPLKNENKTLSIHDKNKRQIAGSIAFVPSVAGLLIASEVIKDICGEIYARERY